jgi:hypothetical protein
MISSIVKSDTSSQIYKVLQRLEEYDVKFVEQERMNEKLHDEYNVKFAEQGRVIAGLSTKVARVSYTSSFMTPA